MPLPVVFGSQRAQPGALSSPPVASRSILGTLSLWISLAQVEGAPKVVKEGLKKEEAEALQKTLTEGEPPAPH